MPEEVPAEVPAVIALQAAETAEQRAKTDKPEIAEQPVFTVPPNIDAALSSFFGFAPVSADASTSTPAVSRRRGRVLADALQDCPGYAPHRPPHRPLSFCRFPIIRMS